MKGYNQNFLSQNNLLSGFAVISFSLLGSTPNSTKVC